jgi:hypothetical protein
VRQATPFRPFRDNVEPNCRDKQRDWKMDQHYMLRVLGQEHRLGVERIYHRHSPLRWNELLVAADLA